MGAAGLAVQLLLGLLDRATQVTQLIDKARAENRDVTVSELDALSTAFDEANAKLTDAIAEAKAQGK